MSHDNQPTLEDMILQKVTSSIADNLLKGNLGNLFSNRILETVGETLVARAQNESPIDTNVIIAQPRRLPDGTGIVLFNTYQHYRPGRNSIIHVDAREYEILGIEDNVTVTPLVINSRELDKSLTQPLPPEMCHEVVRQLKGAQKLKGIQLYAFMVFGPQTQFPPDFEFIEDAPQEVSTPSQGLTIDEAVSDEEFAQQLERISALHQESSNDGVQRTQLANGRHVFAETPAMNLDDFDTNGRLKMPPDATQMFEQLKQNARAPQIQDALPADADCVALAQPTLVTHQATPTPVHALADTPEPTNKPVVAPGNIGENWLLVANIVRPHFIAGGDSNLLYTEAAYARACQQGFVGNHIDWCAKAKITVLALTEQMAGSTPTPA